MKARAIVTILVLGGAGALAGCLSSSSNPPPPAATAGAACPSQPPASGDSCPAPSSGNPCYYVLNDGTGITCSCTTALKWSCTGGGDAGTSPSEAGVDAGASDAPTGTTYAVTLRNVSNSPVNMIGPGETFGPGNLVPANGPGNSRPYTLVGNIGDSPTFSANPGGTTRTVSCTIASSTALGYAEVVVQPAGTGLTCVSW